MAVEQDLALGQLIYDLRTEAGLTQSALAERMGTTQSVISRLEKAVERATASTPSPALPPPSTGTSWSRSSRRSRPSSRMLSRSPDLAHPHQARRSASRSGEARLRRPIPGSPTAAQSSEQGPAPSCEMHNGFLLFLLLCGALQGCTDWYGWCMATRETPAQGHSMVRIGTG